MAEGEYKSILEVKIRLGRHYNYRRLRAYMRVEGIDVAEHTRTGFCWWKHKFTGFANGCKYELVLSGRNVKVTIYSDREKHEELSGNRLLKFLNGISEKK